MSAGVRRSFYDADSIGNNALVANTLFVNYRVSASIVLKMEHHWFNYNDTAKDDYQSTLFSAVAYLGN